MFNDFERLTAELKAKLDDIEREIFKDWPSYGCVQIGNGIRFRSDIDITITNIKVIDNYKDGFYV